jgi:tRNA threonylcarbamoyladenosine biosynthesis protein TsaB
MRVIGIDTTTKVFCLALVQDEKILERLIVEGDGYHAEDFVMHLEAVLQKQALQKEAIDGYAISIGPGSLTGVRVGLSFLKGLGFATGKPVVGVPTLYAIAYEARDETACVCPMLLTRREQLFWALYLFSQEPPSLVEASCSPIEELLQEMPDREILFLGSGALVYRGLIEDRLGEMARFGENRISHPDPATIAILGLESIRDGAVPPLDTLEPIYLGLDREMKIRPVIRSNHSKGHHV